jgi:hypothetical protein
MIHACLRVDRVLVAKDEHMAAFGIDPADTPSADSAIWRNHVQNIIECDDRAMSPTLAAQDYPATLIKGRRLENTALTLSQQ